jgi:hypothetical protein
LKRGTEQTSLNISAATTARAQRYDVLREHDFVTVPCEDGSLKILAAIFTITPAEAQLMLSTQVKNRTIQSSHLHRMTTRVRTEWQFDGSPIRFDEDGHLFDGQTRLNACIKSSTPIKCLVLHGIPTSAFAVMDTGKVRSGADTLSAEGIKDANVVAAAVRTVLILMQESPHLLVSNLQIEHAYSELTTIHQSVSKARPAHHILETGLGAGLHFVFAQRDARMADWFFERLADGSELRGDDPVLVLRERLRRKLEGRAKIPRTFKMAISIKAWNALRRGRKIGLLKWIESEEWPRIE